MIVNINKISAIRERINDLMAREKMIMCCTLHTINAWSKMLEIKTNITSVDKVVFRLIISRLPFTLYPWNFNPFMKGGGQWYLLLYESTRFLVRL